MDYDRDKFEALDLTREQQDEFSDMVTDNQWDKIHERFGVEVTNDDMRYYDDVGSDTGLTETHTISGIGCIDIDGEYNTTYTEMLCECSDEELQVIWETKDMGGYYCSDDIYDYCKEKLGIEDDKLYRLMNHDGTGKPKFESFTLSEYNLQFGTHYHSVEEATEDDPEYLFSQDEIVLT